MIEGKRSIAFSCVVDVLPRFCVQSLIWFWTLREYLDVPIDDVFVHYTPGCDAGVVDYFKVVGVKTIKVDTYSSISPPCNKLRQLQTKQLGNYDYVVLSDCDKVYFEEFGKWIRGDVLRACQCVARPPYNVFVRLYEAAGLPPPRAAIRGRDPRVSEGDPRTPPNNVNGGTYIIPRSIFSKLSIAWPKWADWLLEHIQLIHGWERNLDQISMCLALEELGTDIGELPKYFDYGMNVANVPACSDGPVDLVGALHYHNSLDRRGMITAGPKCQRVILNRIQAVNDLIGRRAMDCPAFQKAVAQLGKRATDASA